ncbi:ABC transporter permease [Leifsonia sp. Root112D2]|uniref:ABC transporter permease n=1 Tax=Leifsonia sp. Root112D2 TaxID=1736426 RepID=UPI0006FAB994|nr:ABC transporter permease [Leifsonia sp. Root112D2]KQV06068.1 ABC transporter permease [Leifsonia sp. Root112D2]
MSTAASTSEQNAGPIALERTQIKSWKAPIALGVFAVIAVVLFIGIPREGQSSFRFTEPGDAIALPNLVVPTHATGVIVAILLVILAALSVWLIWKRGASSLWLVIVFAVVFMFGFLSWAAANHTVPFTGLLLGSVSLSVPLVFGALGGVISERAGVVNIAIEGQLLAGAFVSAVVASVTHNVFAGLVGAMVAGVLVSFVLGAFAIKYLVDQVIVGVVLNVLVTGLTSFLFSQVLSANTPLLNDPPRLSRLPIPLLSDIPVVGQVLFNQSLIVYLMYLAVFLVWFGLFRTRWGLRMRAVGEHPTAADTVGINVTGTRFWNVALAGAVAGLGGAYFTLVSAPAFGKEMTAGAGFIALAAVIFGRWHPVRATLAALLFGFASYLQTTLGVIGSPVPSEFMLMLPYVVTIFAVAGLVGLSRAPAADGKPYIKS